jgi:hypothetical protein
VGRKVSRSRGSNGFSLCSILSGYYLCAVLALSKMSTSLRIRKAHFVDRSPPFSVLPCLLSIHPKVQRDYFQRYVQFFALESLGLPLSCHDLSSLMIPLPSNGDRFPGVLRWTRNRRPRTAIFLRNAIFRLNFILARCNRIDGYIFFVSLRHRIEVMD